MFPLRGSAKAQYLLAQTVALGLATTADAQSFSRTVSVGSPTKYPDDEDDRVKVFHELHGEWPPPWTYPGGKLRSETESEGWTKMMEDLEGEVRSLDGQHQWERWLDVAQMHLAKNYSEKGYLHTQMEPELHRQIADLFDRSYEPGKRREGQVAPFLVGRREMWHIGKLGRKLTDQLLDYTRRKVAEWINVKTSDLVQTSFYGFRVFQNGSIVKPHVEKFTTHVLTAAYCVAARQDEGAPPWFAGHDVAIDGGSAWVDLKPGEMLLYESAKMPHSRPTPFIGDHYALLNVHFAPKEWRLENWDRMYAVPEDYKGQKMTHIELFAGAAREL